ncbi:MAG: hypothetical protein AAGD07_22820 [Planctomycetota bacterium]
MSTWAIPLDVMLFELRRSFTVGRSALWFVLVAFPVGILTAVSMIARLRLGEEYTAALLEERFGMAMYFLIPEVTCLLGLLLWATPAISTEVEGQTWVYLAMRSKGRISVLLGKYLTAVTWTLSAAITAVTLSCVAIGWEIGSNLWAVLCLLALLSCVAHAALYVVIGAVFYRRTMIAAVTYTMVVEYFVSFIPALVNQITINYRLRGILIQWKDWDTATTPAQAILGSDSIAMHMTVLAVMTILLLAFATHRVQRTEYPTQQEG